MDKAVLTITAAASMIANPSIIKISIKFELDTITIISNLAPRRLLIGEERSLTVRISMSICHFQAKQPQHIPCLC